MPFSDKSRTGPVAALVLVTLLAASAFAWRWYDGPDRRASEARALLVGDAHVEDLVLVDDTYHVVLRPRTNGRELRRVSQRVLSWQQRREEQGRPLHATPLLDMGPAQMVVTSEPDAVAVKLFLLVASWEDPALVDVVVAPEDLELRVHVDDSRQSLIRTAVHIGERLDRLDLEVRAALDSVTISDVDASGDDTLHQVWIAEGSFATDLPSRALLSTQLLADLDPGLMVTRGDVVKVSIEAPDGDTAEELWPRLTKALTDVPGAWVELQTDDGTFAGRPQDEPQRVGS